MHYTQEPDTVPPEDREAYIKENAVAIVNDRDRKIDAQREANTLLHKQNESLRKENEKLRKEIEHLKSRDTK